VGFVFYPANAVKTGALIKLTGRALVASGAILALAAVFAWSDQGFAEDPATRWYLITAPLPPLLLLLNWLPSLHENQRKHIDWKGRYGSIGTLAGSIVVIGALIAAALGPEGSMMRDGMFYAGGLALLTGTALLAMCAWGAHVFPRGGGVLLAVGWVGFWTSPMVASPPLFFIPALCLFGAGWTWLAHALAFERPRVLTEAEMIEQAYERR